jgi:hypothetical protein
LDSILEKQKISQIDFVSIDVEGHEEEVLNGFDLKRYQPRFILIEDNSGRTDLRISKFLSKNGYKLWRRTGCNDWYARGTEIELFQGFSNRTRIAGLKLKQLQARFIFRLKPFLRLLKSFLPTSIVDSVRKIIVPQDESSRKNF